MLTTAWRFLTPFVKADAHAKSKPVAPPEFFSPQVSEARRFYLDLSPSKKSALAVVCGGSERCLPDYRIQRTSFPFLTIEFVARGRGTLRLRHQKHQLQAGSVFCYGPGIPHQIATDSSEPLVKYFIDFSGRRAMSLLREATLAPGRFLQLAAPGEVRGVFDELIRNGLKAGRHAARICATLLELLVLKIAESRVPMSAGETQSFANFQHCRRHIVEQFARLRTLEQITRECHVNGAYLCRLFRRYEQQSPYQFLLRLKMNLAAELLLQPNSLIKQVGERIGFEDPFHFSRAFKGVFGVSPAAFRRLH